MNRSIEFHDSTIARVDDEGSVAIIFLRPAYIHESDGEPGVDAGNGIVQDVELRISDAEIISAPTIYPCNIDSGTLKVGNQLHDNLIPLPRLGSDAIVFECATIQNERLYIRGTGVAVVLTGERQFVESYLGENAP